MSELPDIDTGNDPADEMAQVAPRDDVQSGRVQEIQRARLNVQKVRQQTSKMQSQSRGYSNADANSDYLAAVQELIMVLEPAYNRTEVCPEYWERDSGDVIATLQRPAIDKTDVLDSQGWGRHKYPDLENPEALEPEIVATLRCLPDMVALEDARIPYSVTLRPRGRGEPTRHAGTVVLSRPIIDRARSMCLEFAEESGFGLEMSDNDPLEV